MAKGESENTSASDVNKGIYEILVKIRQKCHDTIQAIPSKPEKKPASLPIEEPEIDRAESDLPDDVIKEIVILSADDFRVKPLPLEVTDDDVPETIIVKSKPAQPSETPAPDLQPTDAPREKTAPTKPQESDIPETVIFSHRKFPASHVDSEQKRSAETKKSGLSEQTISNTHGEQRVKEEPTKMKENNNDIPETVIFNPDKNKDK